MSRYGMSKETEDNRAKFAVLGVGGGGGNAVAYIAAQKLAAVNLVAVDTDAQALSKISVPRKYHLGKKTSTNGNPKTGHTLAETHQDEIRALMTGYDMVFIAASLGGGTGTGAAPMIAKIAKTMGILTMAIVSMPFEFEEFDKVGSTQAAEAAVQRLLKYADAVMVVPNEKILQKYNNLSIDDVFKKSDDMVWQAVQSIVGMVRSSSMIHIDFDDIVGTIQNSGYAMVGVGRAAGNQRAKIATEQAVSLPLLDNLSLKNAKNLLVSTKGTQNSLYFGETDEIAKMLMKLANLDEHCVFWSMIYDETMGDELQVTIIVTGLE